MNKQNTQHDLYELENDLAKKYKKRVKKKKGAMKMNGVGVKNLQKIIKDK